METIHGGEAILAEIPKVNIETFRILIYPLYGEEAQVHRSKRREVETGKINPPYLVHDLTHQSLIQVQIHPPPLDHSLVPDYPLREVVVAVAVVVAVSIP